MLASTRNEIHVPDETKFTSQMEILFSPLDQMEAVRQDLKDSQVQTAPATEKIRHLGRRRGHHPHPIQGLWPSWDSLASVFPLISFFS